MLTVFLAYVIFTSQETAPRIVAGFKTLDECVIAARQKNLDTLNHPAKEGEAYVCLQLRADV